MLFLILVIIHSKVKVLKIHTIMTNIEEKAGYLADKEKKKQQILSIYYEYDGRPGYRMMVIFLRRRVYRFYLS